MDAFDPFDSISKLCRASPSEEELLRHCSFVSANEPKEKGANEEEYVFVSLDTGRLFTREVMLTSPDSSVANDGNDNNASVKTQLESSLIAGSNNHRNDGATFVGGVLDVSTEAGKVRMDDLEGKHTLPVSVSGQPDKNAENEEMTLLDVLIMLLGDRDYDDYDNSIKNTNILDIAKSRGMTFP